MVTESVRGTEERREGVKGQRKYDECRHKSIEGQC